MPRILRCHGNYLAYANIVVNDYALEDADVIISSLGNIQLAYFAGRLQI